MRYAIIKSALLLLSMLNMVGCVTESLEIDRQYQIANKSQHPIRIRFHDTFREISFEVALEVNEVYNGDVLTYRSGNDQLDDKDSFFPSSAYGNSDSLTIFFNDTKYVNKYFTLTSPTKALFSEPSVRNPFRHGSYKRAKNEEFLFEITEEDYELAISCEGPCDQ